jgi:hypothetical protein
MGNVLSKVKREQVIALGRLGWSLRRIEEATGVRRETAGDYLRSSGIVVAGGPLITVCGTVPRSSRSYRDERFFICSLGFGLWEGFVRAGSGPASSPNRL